VALFLDHSASPNGTALLSAERGESRSDGRFVVEKPHGSPPAGALTSVTPDGDSGSTATGRESSADRPFAVERGSIWCRGDLAFEVKLWKGGRRDLN
jgi:hypothetical protein